MQTHHLLSFTYLERRKSGKILEYSQLILFFEKQDSREKIVVWVEKEKKISKRKLLRSTSFFWHFKAPKVSPVFFFHR